MIFEVLLLAAYSFIWWQILAITVISSGYHRYFAHRSFKASIWYEYYVLFLGSLTSSGPLLGWAGIHRLHHKHEDTEQDPHSPIYKGIWKVFISTFAVPPISPRIVSDLLRNSRVMWFYKNHKKIRIITILLGVALLPFNWFLILIISPIIYGRIGFGLINAFCHDINGGGAKNSHLVNIIAAGDGFHKNHHSDPKNWRIGKKWYEFDPGAWFIAIIKKKAA